MQTYCNKYILTHEARAISYFKQERISYFKFDSFRAFSVSTSNVLN